MSVAGDLHWERTSAGLYHTIYWANGYKYMIRNANADYGPPNEWRVYYRWIKSKNKDWKWLRRGYGSSYDTLKAAKAAAHSHNLHPRSHWKFMGRLKNPNVLGLTYYERKQVGNYMYQEETREGKLIPYAKKFLDPKALIKNLPQCMFEQCDFHGYSDEELNKHYVNDHNVPDLSKLESSSG